MVKTPRKPPFRSGKPSPSAGKRRMPKAITPGLSVENLIAFLQSQNGEAAKPDIIRHFNIEGQQNVALRQMLQNMTEAGHLEKDIKHMVRLNRDVISADYKPRVKAPLRTAVAADGSFSGIFNTQRRGGGVVKSTLRQDKTAMTILPGDTLNAHDGDLVEVKNNKIVRIIAAHGEANFVSLLAIRNFDVPDAFPAAVIAETQGMVVPQLGNRTDLRDLPLVTIDGEDARDFDDAVHATPDTAPDNKNGWVITVAIADVSHYVRPGSDLDQEAYKRGNSLYFPDRVVPMLPEALSNDLCSLRPYEPRACMAIIMRVNGQGEMIDQKIVRALMQSKARLTYNQVQHALDGQPDETTKPLLADIIMPLYGAYKTLLRARQERGTIDLDMPERKIELKNGIVAAIHQRERFDSHKLIEEMMILANVAAATLLEEKHQPLLYRIHPKPDPVRLESTRGFLKEFGYHLKTGVGLKPKDFRQILHQSEGHEEYPLINEIMLRTMSQAEYSPHNAGHFGLALERYAHFTSPIRRYADLIVHRALIKAYGLGDDGLTEAEQNKLPAIGQHISDRERVAQAAERETIDRYVALYLQDKVGQTFAGRISGVTRAGLFVTLDDTGADGLLPMRLLPQDYYVHDEQRHMLTGRRTGLTFRLATRVVVELMETDPVSGRLVLQLAAGSMSKPVTPSRSRKPKYDDDAVPFERRERGGDRDREHRPERGKPFAKPEQRFYTRGRKEPEAFERDTRDTRETVEWQRPEKRGAAKPFKSFEQDGPRKAAPSRFRDDDRPFGARPGPKPKGKKPMGPKPPAPGRGGKKPGGKPSSPKRGR